MLSSHLRATATCLCALSYLFAHQATAHWLDDPRYPEWAQRGRIVYLDHTAATEEDFALVERYKAEGATPFIHAFTPHWPNDVQLVQRLVASDIPVDVRVEGSLFFEDDHVDRWAFVHGKFLPGGWWYNHVWRTNFDWYRLWPESLRATTRKRNGDEKLAYSGHPVTVRREGSPLAPEHRSVRGKQIAWLLAGVDPLPDVPMRPYENRMAKDPAVPYPMLGRYMGLWYDNPSCEPSYDMACRAAWEKHFKEKFGVELWDPPTHPDANVRREWARFWAEAWVDYYRWRKQYQDELLQRRGRPYCFTSGNFSFISRPNGTAEFYFAKRGVVDMLGPSEYTTTFNRGRFHFLIKTALAASHGRPAGKFYPNDLQIAESLAVSGTNTYRPKEAEFLAANVGLYGNTQPGGRIAVLFHVEQNLIESQLVNLQELVDQITSLGYPYEVVTEDDLALRGELARQFPLLVIANTDFTEEQVAGLNDYLGAGGRLLLIGDCLVEKPRYYDLQSPPPWRPDQTVASALSERTRERVVVDARQCMPTRELQAAIEKLGGPGFRLDPPDPDLLINILHQPNGDLTLVGLVNYSGAAKRDVAIRLPAGFDARHAGWISRDGGSGMLPIRAGRIVVPELRYGCTVILANERDIVERWVEQNGKRFPRPPALPEGQMKSAMEYDAAYAARMDLEDVRGDQTLCRYRVGAAGRSGYLIADVLAPKSARVNQPAEVSIRVLDSRYDYVEYWQLVFEDAATGEREAVPVALPADNTHGEAAKLRGATLTATWTPAKAGTYQAYLAYRVVRLVIDGEPFLEPESVAAGYSGTTPANLFLKSQPLMKRPCEDRLRGMVVTVR